MGGREIIYLTLYCRHQNDSCIKMGSDESHFNVSLIVRDKVTRQCPQTTTFEEKGDPKRYRTEVLPLTSLQPYRWAKRVLFHTLPKSISIYSFSQGNLTASLPPNHKINVACQLFFRVEFCPVDGVRRFQVVLPQESLRLFVT